MLKSLNQFQKDLNQNSFLLILMAEDVMNAEVKGVIKIEMQFMADVELGM